MIYGDKSKMANKKFLALKQEIISMSRLTKGFTLVELLIVISIIGIIGTIGIISYSGWSQTTAITQMKSDLSGAATAMQNARNFGSSGYPADINTLNTFKASSNVTLYGGSNDGGATYCIEAVNSQFPSLYYNISSTNNGEAKSGRCVFTYTLTLVASPTSGGTVSGGGTTFSHGDTATITANANPGYTFSSWSGTGCSGDPTHSFTVNEYMTCTAIFTSLTPPTPTAPVVATNTVIPTTTYSWGATTCTASNTARYQYRYTINKSTPYDSGWVATASTSFVATTSTGGLTYSLAVQAQCFNGAYSSSWSDSGSASYVSPYYSLTLVASPTGGGTVSGGGTTYSYGDTPTITATPSTGYTFGSWTGTGCSGTASHVVSSITADMTCTASFLHFSATGGTITYSGGYTIHTFTASGTFTPNMAGTIEILVVGGGGSGGGCGGSGCDGRGGGGAGGFVYNASYSISGACSVVVGPGGTATYLNGNPGTNSSFCSVVASGGGSGGNLNATGGNGGSGGGSGYTSSTSPKNGGTATSGQGYTGGKGDYEGSANGLYGGGGGGGGGAVGGSGYAARRAGNGGIGLSNSISGTAKYYAGGGGASSSYLDSYDGLGGNGGGGAGSSSFNGYAGTANTGGGGGGSSATNGGAGGSGVVIVRYPT